MKHKFSKEILYHFNCGKCDKWWSIADHHLLSNDVPKKEEIVPNYIICPHCGHKEEAKEVKNNIPKVIHKVYIQHDGKIPSPLHPNIKEAHDSWKKLNPEYEIKLWSLEDCREYLSNNFSSNHLETFDCIQAYAGKCDFFRYCLIYKEGGWYSDWKQVCVVDNLVNKLLNNNDFIYFYDKGIEYTIKHACVQCAFFGSIPQHPILEKAIKIIIELVKKKYYGNSALDIAGPCMFGRVIRHYNNNNKRLESQGVFNHMVGGTFHHKKLGRIIQHKCVGCGDGQDWKNGNNYFDLWREKKYYCE